MSTTKPRNWPLDLIFGLLMLTLVALSVRAGLLVHSQRMQGLQFATRQESMKVPLPARPGYIYAKAGAFPVLLAGSKQVPSCFVDLREMRDDEMGDIATRVGEALGLDAVDLNRMFFLNRGKEFQWIKRNITPTELAAMEKLKLKFHSIGITHEWQREYPNAGLASTVIGWCQGDNLPGGGVELSQYKLLAPVDGVRMMLATASRQPLEPIPNASIMPKDGHNVYLTIDQNIQEFLEQAVKDSVGSSKAKWGVGIVVRPSTGEVLAMTSFYLDPKTREPFDFSPDEFGKVPAEARANMAINVPYEPGSAAKTIYAASAVDAGVVDWDTRIFCENGIYHSPRGGTISDHGAHYGMESVREIVAVSSNVGMGKIGEKCGNDLLYDIAKRFGLGQRSGIELPGETPGILRYRRKWDGYSTLRVPFGQEISVSALQLTMAYAALANGGELLKPHIIDYVTDAGGNVIYRGQRDVIRRVIKASVAKQALSVMQGVVEEGITGHTGKKARSDIYTTFGKTGTAQIPSTTPGKPGYIEGAFTATFVGGAPVENPEIVCLISVHWPKVGSHYGADVAGPYFKQVVEKTLAYLNVPPDKESAQPVVAMDHPAAGHLARR